METRVLNTIYDRLSKIEQEKGVKILYACEAGSRAWGFPSSNADYDIRFIYSRPRDWYLSYDVESKKDVIELSIQDEYDINGWDLKKSLYLLSRTNGSLLEWLYSPICYLNKDKQFQNDLRLLALDSINQIALCYHYSHMAKNNFKDYIERDLVKIKKISLCDTSFASSDRDWETKCYLVY